MNPLISAFTLAYNQEKFLPDCLNGLLMQKICCEYEAVVHDDASPDSSARIIRGFAERYSDIIRPCLETENLYQKHDGSLADMKRKLCRGKYIALCEGDDYWTSTDKLQKQVDFLESHPEYSMCFHNAIEHFEDGSHPDRQFSNIEDRDYEGRELYEHWIVPTASVVFRREVVESEFYRRLILNPNFCYGDILLWISCAKMGKIRGMSDVMSVYRRHSDGAVYNTPTLRHCLHNLEIYKAIGGEYKEIARRLFFNDAIRIIKSGKESSKVKRQLLKECLVIDPVKTIYRFCIKAC